MASSQLLSCLYNIESKLFQFMKIVSSNHGSFHPALSLVPLDPRFSPLPLPQDEPSSLLSDAILWAVPKKKRSRQRVMIRKFGSPNFHSKLLPVKKLLTCLHCGGPYEIGHLCPTCFTKRQQEAKEVQKAASDKFGLSPVDKEFFPIYEGETPPHLPDHVIVQLNKPRPSFFSHNLKTPSTPANPDSTAVDVVPEAKVIS